MTEKKVPLDEKIRIIKRVKIANFYTMMKKKMITFEI